MRVELVWTVSLALLLGCGGAPPLSKPQSGPGTQNPTPPGSPSTQTGQPGPTNTPQPATCSGLTAQPLDSDWTLQFGGLSRVFHVHVPSTYDPATPTPLPPEHPPASEPEWHGCPCPPHTPSRPCPPRCRREWLRCYRC